MTQVVWSETGEVVDLPERLILNGSKSAQARYLISSGQITDPDAPPLPSFQAPEAITAASTDAAALEQLQARVDALEGQSAPVLPSDQALMAWSQQAARVSLSHAEMAALADQAVVKVESIASAAQTQLDGLDARQSSLESTVAQALSDQQAEVAQSVAAAEAQQAQALTEIEDLALRRAEAVALDQIGPQGAPGQACVISTEDPLTVDLQSWETRWLGRGLIAGDSVLVLAPDGLQVRRWTGSGWAEGPRVEPKVVTRDVKISALDASTKSFPTAVVQPPAGGGGSGGSERLLARTINGSAGSSILISDSSRFAIPLKQQHGAPTPTAVKVMVELISANGPTAGSRLLVTADVVLNSIGNTESVIYAMLGELANGGLEVSFNLQRRPVTLPAGINITVPAGTDCCQLWLTVDNNAGNNNTGTFLLAGAVEWLLPLQGAPHTANDPTATPLIPAWEI